MLRALLVLACVLFPSLALAQTAFDGFYVGTKLGADLLSLKATYTEWDGDSAADDASGDEIGLVGGFYLGGGTAFKKRIYLGGELDYLYHGQEVAFNDDVETLRLQWSMGGKVRLGSVFKKVHLVYGLAGLRLGSFEYETTSGYETDDDMGSLTRLGYSVGAGYEYAFTKHLKARIEYAYTYYEPIDINYIGGAWDDRDEKISTMTNDVTLGLTLYF